MKRNRIKDLKKRIASNFVTRFLVIVLLLVAGCNKELQWTIKPELAILNKAKRNGIITASIPLGNASPYIVLVANTIVNQEESIIRGDVGVGSKSTTGLKSELKISKPNSIKVNTIKGKVIGPIHTSSAKVEQAHNDAVLSYYFLINQSPDIVFKNINQLDEQTLSPGIYYFPSWVNLTMNGTLTLDFQGNDQALFIFQLGNSLTTMSNSNIVAINTVNSENAGENVFWAVGSSANISGNSFIGNVIALGDISMSNAGNTSGATNVFGRIISLRGSLTMIKSNINKSQNTSKVTNHLVNTYEHFVTGGGSIEQNINERDSIKREGNSATFGLSCGIKNGQYWGLLSFVDHSYKGTRLKSISITAFTVIDQSTREIKGVGKVNNRDYLDYTLIIKENGGDSNVANFDLKLSNGYIASGPLMDGGIQFHVHRFDSLGAILDNEYKNTQLVNAVLTNHKEEGWSRHFAFKSFRDYLVISKVN
jgi:hypothetical protein